jgi:hypothetical protein
MWVRTADRQTPARVVADRLGLDEAYRYIHDFMLEQGPFDVGPPPPSAFRKLDTVVPLITSLGHHGILTRSMYGSDCCSAGES